MPPPGAVLEARGLTKSFGDVHAVDAASFALHRGEICGLLGPNGAGKSTTIRMMLGLVHPDEGYTILLGERVGPGAPVLRRVGALVEEAAFYPFLSGRENLRLYQRAGVRGGGGLGRRAPEREGVRGGGGLGRRTPEREGVRGGGGLGRRTPEREGVRGGGGLGRRTLEREEVRGFRGTRTPDPRETRGGVDVAGVERALSAAGLEGAADRKVKTYSHGMRQRLGFAQAMLGQPDVLVLDEPTTGLDPSGIREIRELLRSLARRGTAILLSSHLLAEVESLCTTVVVMRSGRVIARAPVADMLAGRDTVVEVDEPQRALAALATAGIDVDAASNGELVVRHGGRKRSDIVRLLVESGVGVSSVRPRASLEEAFFALTQEDPESL